MVTKIREMLNKLSDDAPKSEMYAAHFMGKISSQILNKRLALNMTQKDFAEKLGISQVMLSKYESGDCNFTIRKLADLCMKLNIDLDISLESDYPFEKMVQKNWEPVNKGLKPAMKTASPFIPMFQSNAGGQNWTMAKI